MNENKIEKPSVQSLQVRIPDSVGHGSYANVVSITSSENEVIIDFVLNVQNGSQALLTSRVIVTPTTAQQLSDLLEVLLRKQKNKKEGKNL